MAQAVNTEQMCRTCQQTYTVTGGDFDPNWTIHPGQMWREALAHKGVTQAQAAEALDITQQYLSNILCGDRLPKVELCIRFANYVGVEPRFIWQLVANYKLGLAMGKKDVT